MSEQDNRGIRERSRALFQDSVDGLDFAHALAPDAGAQRRDRGGCREAGGLGYVRWQMLAPAAGVTAAAVLGAVLWLGSPLASARRTVADGQSNLEDLDLVASSDEGPAMPWTCCKTILNFMILRTRPRIRDRQRRVDNRR